MTNHPLSDKEVFIKSERAVFNEHFGVSDDDLLPAGEGTPSQKTLLSSNWLGWKARAELAACEKVGSDSNILVELKDITELMVKISKIDLMTHSDSRSDEEKLAWQSIAQKVTEILGKAEQGKAK